jgi:hypothetical protein
MAQVTLSNRTKSDFVFPVYETEEKEVMRTQVVKSGEGHEILNMPETIEVRKSKTEVHLPPTFDPQNPGQVTIDEETYEALPNVDSFVENNYLDVLRA